MPSPELERVQISVLAAKAPPSLQVDASRAQAEPHVQHTEAVIER